MKLAQIFMKIHIIKLWNFIQFILTLSQTTRTHRLILANTTSRLQHTTLKCSTRIHISSELILRMLQCQSQRTLDLMFLFLNFLISAFLSQRIIITNLFLFLEFPLQELLSTKEEGLKEFEDHNYKFHEQNHNRRWNQYLTD